MSGRMLYTGQYVFFKETGTALALRRRSKTEFNTGVQRKARLSNRTNTKAKKINKAAARSRPSKRKTGRQTHRKELEHLKAQTPG
jgi:hypothetical protein